MRAAAIAFLFALVTLLLPVGDGAAAEGDMSGDWSLTVDYEGAPAPLECVALLVDDGMANLFGPVACGPALGASYFHGQFDKATREFSFVGDYPTFADDLLIGFAGALSEDGDSLAGSFDSSIGIDGTFTGNRTTSVTRWGDANCDTAVASIDALGVLHSVIGTRGWSRCIGFADVDIDSYFDTDDALLILQAVAGLVPRLPVLPDA